MSRRTLSYLSLAALTMGLALAIFLASPPAAADLTDTTCGECTGSVRQASGTGSGDGCYEAQQEALKAAMADAYQHAPEHTPCNITNGPVACSLPTGGSTTYGGTWTLYYQTRACSVGGSSYP